MSLSTRLSVVRVGLLKFLRTSSALLALVDLGFFGTLGYNLGASWYWLMATALLPALVYLVLRRAVSEADARSRARKRWKSHGPAVERVPYTQFEALRERYSEETSDETRGFVDRRTWDDLGMDRVHERIDVCFTMPGRNELYRMLRHTLPEPEEVSRRVELMRLFVHDEPARLAIAQTLARVGEERDADPATILWGDSAKTDDLFPLFVAMSACSVLAIVITAAFNPTLGIISMVVMFFANMWVYYRKARHLSAYVPALRVLSRMTEAARDVPWYDLPALHRTTSGAKHAFRWLLTGAPSPSPTLSGDITEVFFLYVKIYFQADLIAYNRLIGSIRRNIDSYRALYQGIGSVDALYALASYRARRKRSCDADVHDAKPEHGAAGSVDLVGAYHPLIERAIPNTVTLGQPGAIVTGTNMAGKSTFLRTVGINVLFAQTVGYAFAKSFSAPRMRVMSSIEKQDSLEEGKSFYYDEAERIYLMIEEVGEQTPVLLLIDELLSGTNSLERESASVAILHYLAERPALTIAATHDVTIARGVADRYDLFYFTDDADEHGLTFDYKIHEGVVETRNAIKLLRLIGYPEDVITRALERTQGL